MWRTSWGTFADLSGRKDFEIVEEPLIRSQNYCSAVVELFDNCCLGPCPKLDFMAYQTVLRPTWREKTFFHIHSFIIAEVSSVLSLAILCRMPDFPPCVIVVSQYFGERVHSSVLINFVPSGTSTARLSGSKIATFVVAPPTVTLNSTIPFTRRQFFAIALDAGTFSIRHSYWRGSHELFTKLGPAPVSRWQWCTTSRLLRHWRRLQLHSCERTAVENPISSLYTMLLCEVHLPLQGHLIILSTVHPWLSLI